MKRITTKSYQKDKYYPRIVKAVVKIFERGADVLTPIDVFCELQLLTRKSIEDWRFGRVHYLERVIGCNLSKANRILRILRMHAHDLNLIPSQTAYHRWGKSNARLRFSKTGDPGVEEAYRRHFLLPGKPARREEIRERVVSTSRRLLGGDG